MAFRGLQAESEKQGQVHKDISKDLRALVADPFNEWAQGYEVNMQIYTMLFTCDVISLAGAPFFQQSYGHEQLAACL